MQFAFYILSPKLEFLLKGAKKERVNQTEPIYQLYISKWMKNSRMFNLYNAVFVFFPLSSQKNVPYCVYTSGLFLHGTVTCRPQNEDKLIGFGRRTDAGRESKACEVL